MDTTGQFAGKAGVYSKYRPDYPVALFNKLAESALPNRQGVVADVGAGTGIFSRWLLELGADVIAVEPNDDMRAAAQAYLGEYKRVRIHDGTAENTGLVEKSVDLVTVAQAFHWFDKQRFRQECKRILKPDGQVAIVWNSRDVNAPIHEAYIEICKEQCPTYSGFERGVLGSEEEYPVFFRNGVFERSVFPNPFSWDLEQFQGRCLSSSFAPRENEENYLPFTNALQDLFDTYQSQGRLLIPNVTLCLMGRV